MEDAFLLGPGLLVAPVLEAGAAARIVYLPKGSNWCAHLLASSLHAQSWPAR